MKKFLSLLVAVVMLLTASVSALAEFPALDSVAAWDYIGDWYGVSGMDVMGDPTNDYPALELNLFLNGLGDLYLDGGSKEVVGWYIEDGVVFLAHTVDKVPQADDIFAYAYKDETGRLVVDLMTVAVRCEQEGEEYGDVYWPEFDAEDAKYFIGAWAATTYISEGVEVPAASDDEMILVLNDDGTALSVEKGEEPYELRWYSDYAVAYVGETPTELAEISFDGNGNIVMAFDASTAIVMAPTVYDPDAAPEYETALGEWESSSKTLYVNEDGVIDIVYKSDGYKTRINWELVDGTPMCVNGIWKDMPLVAQNGVLTFTDGSFVDSYTRVGEAPETYVGPGGIVASAAAEPFIGNWEEESGRGVLTFNEDCTAVMNFTDGTVYDMNWKTTEDGALFTSGFWFDTAMVIEDENTLNIGDGWMILYREGAGVGEEMPVAQPIGAEGEPYFGAWQADMYGMTMILTLNEDGTCTMDMLGEVETAVWSVENGKAIVDGGELYIDADGNLVMEEEGMVFTRAEEGATTGEMSDEELLMALLAAMAATEGEEGEGSALPEHLQGYVGTWHMCYMNASGITGDMRGMGITGTLTLNEDGTAYMTGFSSDEGEWYEDEDGYVRFGEYGALLQLLDDGFLQYGTELSGMMIFSQDEAAVYDPNAGAASAAPAAPAAPEAPAADARTFSAPEEYMDLKFVAKTYTSYGQTMDASTLGVEYSITFRANGTCDFVMGGINTPGLSWGLQEVAMGLTKAEAFVVNYYGVTYNFIPTETGFDMDFYGTMNLHFVPAE